MEIIPGPEYHPLELIYIGLSLINFSYDFLFVFVGAPFLHLHFFKFGEQGLSIISHAYLMIELLYVGSCCVVRAPIL